MKWCKNVEIKRTEIIKIIKKKGKNSIVGCIYKHPQLAIDEFYNQLLSHMLDKASVENKEVYQMDDFNINQLNYKSVDNKEVYQMDDFNINRLNHESSWKTSDFLKNLHSQSGALCNTASSHHTQAENTDL